VERTSRDESVQNRYEADCKGFGGVAVVSSCWIRWKKCSYMRSSALDELSRTHLLGNPLPFSRFGARLTTTWSACRRFRRCWTSPMCRRTSSTVRELCSLTRGRNPEQPRASPTLVSRASAAFSTISDSAPSAARYACMMRAKLDAAQ